MANTGFSPAIQKRIDALPEDIRKLIQSTDIDSIIQQIGRKHGLHIDQMGALEAEALMTMIGINELEEFAENITTVLSVDKQKSNAIAADVNEQLFGKIRESMKKAPQQPQPVATHETPSTPLNQTPAVPSQKTSSAIVQLPPASAAFPASPTFKPPVTPPEISATPKAPLVITVADMALSQKSVSIPKPIPTPSAASAKGGSAPSQSATLKPPPPPQPGGYTADPYREPPE